MSDEKNPRTSDARPIHDDGGHRTLTELIERRSGEAMPVQSTHTPTVDGWAVNVVRHEGGVWTTIFSVGAQRFEIARGEADDPNAEEHCRWFARMFTHALDARDRLRSEAAQPVWHHMPSPGVSTCGADYPNMSKTENLHGVTCIRCLRDLARASAEAKREPLKPGDEVVARGRVERFDRTDDNVVVAEVNWPGDRSSMVPISALSWTSVEDRDRGRAALRDFLKNTPRRDGAAAEARPHVSALDAFAKSTGLTTAEAARARRGDVDGDVLHVPECACRLRIKDGHFAGCSYAPRRESPPPDRDSAAAPVELPTASKTVVDRAWLNETWLELRASLEGVLPMLDRIGEMAHNEDCDTYNACENGDSSESCPFNEDTDETEHDHSSCECLVWDAATKAKNVRAILDRTTPPAWRRPERDQHGSDTKEQARAVGGDHEEEQGRPLSALPSAQGRERAEAGATGPAQEQAVSAGPNASLARAKAFWHDWRHTPIEHCRDNDCNEMLAKLLDDVRRETIEECAKAVEYHVGDGLSTPALARAVRALLRTGPAKETP